MDCMGQIMTLQPAFARRSYFPHVSMIPVSTKGKRGIEILNEPCADSLLESRRSSKQTGNSINVPTSAVEMVKQQIHILRFCFHYDENNLERLSRQCRDLADYVDWFRSRETGMNDAEVMTGFAISFIGSPQRFESVIRVSPAPRSSNPGGKSI